MAAHVAVPEGGWDHYADSKQLLTEGVSSWPRGCPRSESYRKQEQPVWSQSGATLQRGDESWTVGESIS